MNKQIDLFLYFDELYKQTKVLDIKPQETKDIMKRNFEAPILGITVALPILSKSKAILVILGAVSGEYISHHKNSILQ